MSFDQYPNEQANISGADFAIMCDELTALRAQVAELRRTEEPPAIPQEVCDAMERTDWTPAEALQFYADQKNFDIVSGRARIIDNGAVASNALKHLSPERLELKGDTKLTSLREKVAELTRYKKYWEEWLSLQSGDTTKMVKKAEQADVLEQQLAALAEQNRQMRDVLKLARFDSLSLSLTDWDRLKLVANLPDIATPAINRIKAEGLSEVLPRNIHWTDAPMCCTQKEGFADGWNSCIKAIRTRAAELEAGKEGV